MCSILTPHIRKQPQTSLGITLKTSLKVSNGQSLDGAMYNKPTVLRILGAWGPPTSVCPKFNGGGGGGGGLAPCAPLAYASDSGVARICQWGGGGQSEGEN